ncbi:MAG: drug resistance efflux protein [Friedmanniella sp.]|nr:drug resistance efflux protein [Friedmanniella sp.]
MPRRTADAGGVLELRPAAGRPAEPSAADREVPAPARARLVLVFAGLMAGLLLSELDQTVFATALPTVVGELDGVDQMLWVTTAYVLAATVTLPVYGTLSDRVDRRTLVVVGLVIFVAGSVLGGLAPDMGWLVAARAVQGLGGGGLLVLVQAIVADLVPARERARYLGVVGVVFAVAALAGPPLGGWLAEGPGWRWAFWLNLPLGGAAVVTTALLLRLPARPRVRVRVDVAGIAALTVAVTAVVLVTSWGGTAYAWTSPPVLGLMVVAVVASAVLVGVERRAIHPILPLALLARRNVGLPTAAGMVLAVAMFGTVGYLPTYLQMVFGLGAAASGIVMLSLVAGLALATVGSAQMVARTGCYRGLPVAGAGLVAVALALLSSLTPAAGLAVTGLALLLLGLGIGCVLQILVVVVQNAVPAAQVGTATAAHSFFREIGVAVGSAAVGAAFTQRLLAGLGGLSVAGVDPSGLTPERLARLAPDVRASVALAYQDALGPVLAWLVPLVVLSGLALALVRAEPLSSSRPERSATGGGPA